MPSSIGVKEARTRYDHQLWKRDLLKQQLADLSDTIATKKQEVEQLILARWVISEVARQTQLNIKAYVESLVTMVIQAIYEDPTMKFILDFDISRNKSEAFLYVQEGDAEPYVPKDEMGGGVIDAIGLAMRIVLWSLESPRSRNLIIADEPMKFLGKGHILTRAGDVFGEISHNLGIQLILVTHEPELIEIADKAWFVKKENGISQVSLAKEVVKDDISN
jgi:DNA repair exonuclease SbcCD ATPase subunit